MCVGLSAQTRTSAGKDDLTVLITSILHLEYTDNLNPQTPLQDILDNSNYESR